VNVIIACEFSGTVRDAFIKRGHNAVSCDLLSTEKPGPHIQGDVLNLLNITRGYFDLLIAHPPCTDLSAACANLWQQKRKDGRQYAAIAFFMYLYNAEIPRIAVENPVGVINSKILKPTQIIEPFQFGHATRKRTCLWLKNLPLLKPTKTFIPNISRVYIRKTGQKSGTPYNCYFNDVVTGGNRAHERSRTFTGIAEAMAEQWGES
jgi:site-specific DNA-cytosine methylase